MELRTNDGCEAKQRIRRSDFEKHIRQDIDLQAAKRRRTSDEKPNPQPERDARKNLKIEAEGHQSQRVSEFKTAREKADQDAISRLLSRGDRNSEPHAGT